MRLFPFILLLPAIASAQTGVSVTASSDYRFRGLSLNDNQADLRIDLAYDDAAGCYAGAGITRVEPWQDAAQAQVLAYAGYRGRWRAATDWEAGISLAGFTRNGHEDYGEAYVGLLRRDGSVRFYLSPSYYGSGERTGYGELNLSHPLSDSWYLTAHAGVLTRLGSRGPAGSGKVRIDGLLGIGTNIDSWNIQLAWSGLNRSPFEERRTSAYPTNYGGAYGYAYEVPTANPRLHAVILSATRFF